MFDSSTNRILSLSLLSSAQLANSFSSRNTENRSSFSNSRISPLLPTPLSPMRRIRLFCVIDLSKFCLRSSINLAASTSLFSKSHDLSGVSKKSIFYVR